MIALGAKKNADAMKRSAHEAVKNAEITQNIAVEAVRKFKEAAQIELRQK